jgi:hypothetical protein
VLGSCEHGNGPFVKGGNFLIRLAECLLASEGGPCCVELIMKLSRLQFVRLYIG